MLTNLLCEIDLANFHGRALLFAHGTRRKRKKSTFLATEAQGTLFSIHGLG